MFNFFNLVNKTDDPRLYFIVGQSNAQGTAAITGSEAPSYFGELSDVDGLGHNCYIWNVSAQAWQILEYGVNQQAQDADSFGVEMELGYRAVLNHRTDIYIIKYAESGRGLYEEATERDWNPNSVSELYDELLTETATAMAALSVTVKPEFYFYFGSERDAVFEVRANALNSNLRLYIDSLRSDLYNITFIGVRLNSSFYTYESTVRSAFEDVCSEDSVNKKENSYLLNVDDLEKFGDNVHYVGASQISIANRLLNYKILTI